MHILVIIPDTNIMNMDIMDRWYLIEARNYVLWAKSLDIEYFQTVRDMHGLTRMSGMTGVNSTTLNKIRQSRYTITTKKEALHLSQQLENSIWV